jgi:nicotinate-nucleotide adenylyltransferase
VRIALFGGSFDPVHVGHLIAAQAAADLLDLDQVLLTPANEQPFKQGRLYASPAQRLAMLRAAVATDHRLVADDREIRRAGRSYTVDTVCSLHDDFPGDQLFLLIGSDAAVDFPAWKEGDTIARLATVVVLTRPGVPEPIHEMIAQTVVVPAVDVSATEIRARCARGASIRYLVPPAVRDYIADNGLYLQGD